MSIIIHNVVLKPKGLKATLRIKESNIFHMIMDDHFYEFDILYQISCCLACTYLANSLPTASYTQNCLAVVRTVPRLCHLALSLTLMTPEPNALTVLSKLCIHVCY